MRGHELERGTNYVRIFSGLDLDRVTLKSTTFFNHYVIPGIGKYYSEDGAEVPAGIGEVLDETVEMEGESRGLAFDFVKFFGDRAKERGFGEIDVFLLAEQIVDANRDEGGKIKKEFVDDIITPGALDLIRSLEAEKDGRWAFLTSGGELTQTLKLAVVGVILQEELGILARAGIVSSERKAQEVVDEWYDGSDGKFVVPREMTDGLHLRVDEVRIIDDKKKNTRKKNRRPHGRRVHGLLVHPSEGRRHGRFSGAHTVSGVEKKIKGGRN